MPLQKKRDNSSLFLNQITHRLLYILETGEKNTQKPLVFLDVGYGEKEFFSPLFQNLPLASYTLCHYLESARFKKPKNFSAFLNQVILDKTYLPFVATFDIILVNLVAFLPAQPDHLLRQLIGCLKPGGRLYLVGLGECSFYEWFYACQKAEISFSFPSFLNQRQPIWPEDQRGDLQEEWIELSCPDLKMLLTLFDGLQKNLFDATPFRVKDLQKAFELFERETKGRLTLHLFYGCYTKPEEIQEE